LTIEFVHDVKNRLASKNCIHLIHICQLLRVLVLAIHTNFRTSLMMQN